MNTARKPYLRAVGVSAIPRAEAKIRDTVQTLQSVQFEQDPLFDAGDSFRLSICASAVKREGVIIEAAVKDAIADTDHLRLLEVSRSLKRVPDVQFELLSTQWVIALEIKRGSLHDSGAMRQFRADLTAIPALLRTALPLFPIENVLYHIVFISGRSPLPEGLTLADLGPLYGLHPQSYVQTARQQYSMAIKQLLRERGL